MREECVRQAGCVLGEIKDEEREEGETEVVR